MAMVMVNVMVGAMLLIAGVVMIEPLKESFGISRAALDCDNESITTGEQGACIVNDAAFPIWMLAVFGAAIAFVGARAYQGREER